MDTQCNHKDNRKSHYGEVGAEDVKKSNLKLWLIERKQLWKDRALKCWHFKHTRADKERGKGSLTQP